MAGSLEETTDIELVGDFTPEMREVSGFEALAGRELRRLTTQRGIFPWWPTDGLDVRMFQLSKVPAYRIGSAVDDECKKDEQVDSTLVSLKELDGGRRLRLDIRTFSPLGNFKLTMGVTEAAATLLALEET